MIECYLAQIFVMTLATEIANFIVGIVFGLLVGLAIIQLLKMELRRKRRFMEKRLAVIDSFKTLEAKVGYTRKLLELEIEDIDRKLGDRHA